MWNDVGSQNNFSAPSTIVQWQTSRNLARGKVTDVNLQIGFGFSNKIVWKYLILDLKSLYSFQFEMQQE